MKTVLKIEGSREDMESLIFMGKNKMNGSSDKSRYCTGSRECAEGRDVLDASAERCTKRRVTALTTTVLVDEAGSVLKA